MENLPASYTLDFFVSVLSVFDLGGTIHHSSDIPFSMGLQNDINRLNKDLIVINEDSKKAYDRTWEEFKEALKKLK